MPTFWDLPRDVRDKIYRFNLVQEAAIDVDGFKAACSGLEAVSRSDYRSNTRGKPYLFHFGTRAEKEAAGEAEPAPEKPAPTTRRRKAPART